MLLGDAIVHDLVHRWRWLDARPHLIGGAVLLLAGAFQFSALKDACLQECRHPAVFLQQHYRRGVQEAFSLGRRHGLYCLGCCWALMLVMVSVGIANLAWMAPFALLMLYEKAGRGGDRGAKAVGVGLLALGTLVLLDPNGNPPCSRSISEKGLPGSDEAVGDPEDRARTCPAVDTLRSPPTPAKARCSTTQLITAPRTQRGLTSPALSPECGPRRVGPRSIVGLRPHTP